VIPQVLPIPLIITLATLSTLYAKGIYIQAGQCTKIYIWSWQDLKVKKCVNLQLV